MNFFQREIATPVGRLKLLADDDRLVAILWENDSPERVALLNAGEGCIKPARKHPVLDLAAKQLKEYFAGKRKKFEIPVRFSHGTDFERKVWTALSKIPYG